jgi:glucose-6-phosphate isomerase
MNLTQTHESTLLLPELGFSLDWGRMGLPAEFAADKAALWQGAIKAMRDLEAGAIANPDEKRQVGHYWLRTPSLSPTPAIRAEIEKTLADVIAFSAKLHKSRKFTHALVIGIGGSALGSQFTCDALDAGRGNKMHLAFLDNTDPDGFEKVLSSLELKKTLVVVISKSGSTPETRNGMLAAQAAYARAKVDFAKRAVAITQVGSALDQTAVAQKWLARLPMWDFVGGRTSVTSAVGLLPMALQGIDISEFLAGAAAMDAATRTDDARTNPAAMLALNWLHATGGAPTRAMVVLPYRDRLCFFSHYLQQLVMESLGKRFDLDGREVWQGLTVFGNKGSTDQHAYVQQLRDGPNNFFVNFVEVLDEADTHPVEMENGVWAGDYLQGFCMGTAAALGDDGKPSMTLTLRAVTPFTIGALVALYERAVGYYAHFIHINAYHQPGVEAGKKAATKILELKKRIVEILEKADRPLRVDEIVEALASPNSADFVLRILERLAANSHYNVVASDPKNPFNSTYAYGQLELH